MITIIDYGAGNMKSVQNMLRKIGVASILTKEISVIESANKLILPGVGHFDYGMQQLRKSGLIELLNQKVLIDQIPILGICLGAQMLGNKSEEGTEKGLGWIDMDIVKFDATILPPHLKIPHMSWNEITIKKNTPLLTGFEENPRYYFVHSYYMQPYQQEDILCTANYGEEFVAGVNKKNIFGVQFHPEKSHKFGMQLLKNFASL